jgi:hypothetical protein
LAFGWLLLGGEEAFFCLAASHGQQDKGGEPMAPIVWRTRYGDTIFLANPVKAATAMITWARAHGHAPCEMEDMHNGCVRVNIPGVTSITLAPEGIAGV